MPSSLKHRKQRCFVEAGHNENAVASYSLGLRSVPGCIPEKQRLDRQLPKDQSIPEAMHSQISDFPFLEGWIYHSVPTRPGSGQRALSTHMYVLICAAYDDPLLLCDCSHDGVAFTTTMRQTA